MTWTRDIEWEKRDNVVTAYSSSETRGVYYIVENEDESYTLQHWPNKRKTIETVTIVDSFDELDDAEETLESKIE